MNSKKDLILSRSKGFTILELLVVVAIVGLLTAIFIGYLNSARNKGGDAGVKANLRNAIPQAEIIYGTRTANKDSYTNVCTNGVISGETTITGIGAFILAAAKANGYSSYAINAIGTTSTATCNNSASAWAAEVPLKSAGANQMWCVDSLGRSKQKTGTSLTTAATTVCS